MIEIKLPDFTSGIKAHVARHKTAYLIGTGVAIAGVTWYFTRKAYITKAITNNFSPVINNNNSSAVNFGGHGTKIVKRLSDDKMWGTVTDAANDAGCGIPKMSRHLNGHNPHVYDEVYRIVGVGTTG